MFHEICDSEWREIFDFEFDFYAAEKQCVKILGHVLCQVNPPIPKSPNMKYDLIFPLLQWSASPQTKNIFTSPKLGRVLPGAEERGARRQSPMLFSISSVPVDLRSRLRSVSGYENNAVRCKTMPFQMCTCLPIQASYVPKII